MALPAYKTQAEIPKGFEELYEERDGEWKPKEAAPATEGGGDDIAKLNLALRKERERADAAEKKQREADRKAKEAAADKERQNQGVTEEQLKKIRAEVRAELEEEFKPVGAERDTLKTENRELRLDTKVQALFGPAGVRGERSAALWRLVKDDFDLTDDGKPMVKATPGTPVEKYLADVVKKQYPEFYTGSQAAGGAGTTTAAPASGGPAAVAGAPTFEQIMNNPAAAIQSARDGSAK